MSAALALVVGVALAADTERTLVPRWPAVAAGAIGFGGLALAIGMQVQRDNTNEEIRLQMENPLAPIRSTREHLESRAGLESGVMALGIAIAVTGVLASLFLWWFVDPDM